MGSGEYRWTFHLDDPGMTGYIGAGVSNAPHYRDVRASEHAWSFGAVTSCFRRRG